MHRRVLSDRRAKSPLWKYSALWMHKELEVRAKASRAPAHKGRSLCGYYTTRYLHGGIIPYVWALFVLAPPSLKVLVCLCRIYSMAAKHTVFHIRILFHVILALLWVPWTATMVALLTQEGLDTYTIASMIIYSCIISFWLLIDYITFSRRMRGVFALLEILSILFLFFSLFVCLGLGAMSAPKYTAEEDTGSNIKTNQFQMASIILDAAAYLTFVVMPICFILAFFTLSVIVANLLRLGRHGVTSPLFAGHVDIRTHGHSPSHSLLSWITTFFVGPLRSEAEKIEIKEGFLSFLDGKTSFRKHIFEPRTLAFARGSIAIYAIFGLLIYLIALSLSTYTSGINVSTSTTFVPIDLSLNNISFVVTSNQHHNVLLTNLSAWSYVNHNSTWTQCPQYTWQDSYSILNCTLYDSAMGDDIVTMLRLTYSGFNTSYSVLGDIYGSAAVWLLQTQSERVNTGLPDIYTQIGIVKPFLLRRNFHGAGMLTQGSLQFGAISWATYTVDNLVPDAITNQTVNASSINLVLDPLQRTYLQTQYQNDPVILTVLQVIATLGGVFTVVSGVFAAIFGRSLMAIIAGGRELSPFGMVGALLKKNIREAIGVRFPLLKSELDRGGMADFLKEVAIDVDLIEDPQVPGKSSSNKWVLDGMVPIEDIPLLHRRQYSSNSTFTYSGKTELA